MALISAGVLRLSWHSRQQAGAAHWDIYALWLVLSTIFAYHFTDKTYWTHRLAWLCGATAFVLFFQLQGPQQIWAIAAGACWLLYIFMLRQKTVFKPLLVALVWTMSTHLAFSGTGDSAIWMGIQRFTYVLALTLCYDMADQHFDSHWNTSTIPLHYGTKKTAILAYTALLISGFMLFLLSAHFILMYFFILISLLVASARIVWFLAKNHKKQTKNQVFWSKIAIDALMLG